MPGSPITFSVQPTPGFPATLPPRRQTGVFWIGPASSADYAFDGTNLTATRAVTGASGSQARANAIQASGYFEIKMLAGLSAVGLAPAGSSTSNWIGFVGNTIGYHPGGAIYQNNVQVATYAAFTTGDVVMVALKGGKAYFGKNGTWQSGTDPSAGTGGVDVSGNFTTAIPSASANNVSDAAKAAFTLSNLAYAIPSGITAWDGTAVSLITSPIGLSVVAFLFSNDAAALARARGVVSSGAIAAGETSVLSRTRAFVSNCAEAWTESSVLARLRSFTSTASAVFFESSAISRLQLLISSVASTWAENAALIRIRGVVAAASQIWAETAIASRLRGFVAAGAQVWTEAAALARLRGFVATAAQVWAETGRLYRVRGFVASGSATWAETTVLTRLRGFNASGAAQWTETAAIVRKRQLAGTNGSIWNSLAKFNGTGLTSATVFAFSGSAGLRTARGFVSATVARFSETSLLSIVFVPHGPTLRFTRQRLPFPRAAREDRTRKL